MQPFCITSPQVYEALMTMRTRQVVNLTIFVDVNQFQSDNLCCEIKVLPILPLLFTAFGFTVHEIDGQDACAIAAAWTACTGKLSGIYLFSFMVTLEIN